MDREEIVQIARDEVRREIRAALAAGLEVLGPEPPVVPPVVDPPGLPKGNATPITAKDLDYIGYFTLEDKPKLGVGAGEGPRLGYAGTQGAPCPITIDPTGQGLWIVGEKESSEITHFMIPGDVESWLESGPRQAKQIDKWWDVTGGAMEHVRNLLGVDKPIYVSGLACCREWTALVGRLHWSIQVSYNVRHQQYPFLGHSSTSSEAPRATQPRDPFDDELPANSVAGYLVHRTDDEAFNDYVSCGCVIPQGISSTSWGPVLVTPEGVNVELYYPPEGEDAELLDAEGKLGVLDPRHDWVKCGVEIPGRGVLFFGRKHRGKAQYGLGSEIGGACSRAQGYHAPPYQPHCWSYSQAQIDSDGTQPVPHEFKVELPTWTCEGVITGAAYDPKTKRLYLCHPGAYRPKMEPLPVIHVFEVRV